MIGGQPRHRTELDKLVHSHNTPAFTTHQQTQVHPQGTILLPLDGVTWNMIWGFLKKKLSSKFNFHYNIEITTGTVHANQFIFLIISQSVLPRMKNFSAITGRENWNIFSVQFFLKTQCLQDNVEKWWRAEQATENNMAHVHCMLDN